MGKKRKYQNPKGPAKKKTNFQSNCLLPARSSGEKPDMAFSIKTEEDCDTDMQPTDSFMEHNGQNPFKTELFSFIGEAKINSDRNPESRDSTHTSTEAIETDSNQVVPNVSVKQELADPELSNNQIEAEGATNVTDNITSSLMPQKSTDQETDEGTSLINSCNKSKPVENDEISQRVDESDTNFSIKSEPVENNENTTESQSSRSQGETTRKRKDFTEVLQEIRKRIKPEPVDDTEQMSPSTEIQAALQNNGIDEECLPTAHEEHLPTAHEEHLPTSHEEHLPTAHEEHLPTAHEEHLPTAQESTHESKEVEIDGEDEDIAVLPQPKVKVPIITIDSEDDAESESDMEKNENSPEPYKERNFPTDILKFFNIVSQLDRYDCKNTIELVSKYKTKNNTLETLFPIVKKENRQPYENSLEDILFESYAAQVNFDTTRSTTSQCVVGNVSNLQVCQLAVQPISAWVNSPSVSTSPFPIFSLRSPPLRAAPSANLNQTQNLQTTAFPSTSDSNAGTLSFSDELIEEARRIVELEQSASFLPSNTNSSVAANVNFHDSSISQPSTLPAAPIHPSFSAKAASSLPTPVSASQQHNRDPRLLKRANETGNFAPRKGVENLFLYQKIGKEVVTRHFKTLILQWNPSWMLSQLKMQKYPPICDSYRKTTLSYQSDLYYYNTYFPLHLLNVWFTLYNRWANNQGLNVKCTVQDILQADNVITYSCSNEFEESVRMWPKGDDIALCQHKNENAFLHIVDVKKRPTEVENKKKLKITLKAFHDLKARVGDTIELNILLNIRTAILEAESLTMLHPTWQKLVLMPERHRNDVTVVALQVETPIKQLRDQVLSSGENSRVVLVQTDDLMSRPRWVPLLINQVTYQMVTDERYGKGGKNKVLLLLKDDEMLFDIFRLLQVHKPILAVRTKQFELSSGLLSCTLEDKLERKEKLTDIFSEHNIFITTFSAFGKAERAHLSKCNSWNCIIYDAHLCTEVETAVPMTMKLNKLFLMGNKDRFIQFPDILRDHMYHLTFFDRLFESKKL